MKIKLEPCQGYFTVPDPLYRLNDSPPLNAEAIGDVIKTLVDQVRKSRIQGIVIPPDTYVDLSRIGRS